MAAAVLSAVSQSEAGTSGFSCAFTATATDSRLNRCGNKRAREAGVDVAMPSRRSAPTVWVPKPYSSSRRKARSWPKSVAEAEWETDCPSARGRSWSPVGTSPVVHAPPRRAKSLSPAVTMLVLHSGMVTTTPAAARMRRPVDGDSDPAHQESASTVKWEGLVKHRISQSVTMELFGISVSVPHDLIESFPPTLFVSALQPAEACQLEDTVELQGCFIGTTAEHQATITKMGDMSMVVEVELQDCRLWILPRRFQATDRWAFSCLAQRSI